MKTELEEAAEKRISTSTKVWDLTETRRSDFIAGANYQAEKMYSEEIELINWLQSLTAKKFYSSDAEDLLEQFKKK